MMRDRCVALLYAHTQPAMPLDQYADALAWWEIEPIIVAGELAGALMAFRNKLHIVVRPEFHGRWLKRWMLAFLQDRIDEYGPLETTVFKSNDQAIRFVERLGFQRTDENDKEIRYTLEH